MAKKKTVSRKSKTTSSSRQSIDNNTFLLIVGGGFVVIVLVTLLLGFTRSQSAPEVVSKAPVSMMNEEKSTANIIVNTPATDVMVSRPVTIKGKARVFENQISYRIKDEDGFVLVSGSTIYESSDAGEFGDYTITTNYLEPKGTRGVVEVYNMSAKDGSEENLVSVPVMFKEN